MLEGAIAVCAALLVLTYLLPRRWERGNLVLCAGEEDEDIKIASGPFTTRPQEDLAEQAAQQFLRQKQAGNVDKARELGKAYAVAMIDFERNPPDCCGNDRTQLEIHHQLLLCSFVVNRVIGECSPNSILAQTSLNVFYKHLRELSPSLHKHVGDMAAFSLYILCDRSRNRSEQDIGQVYAQLCGHEGDWEFIDEGNCIYSEFNRRCTELMEQAAYETLE